MAFAQAAPKAARTLSFTFEGQDGYTQDLELRALCELPIASRNGQVSWHDLVRTKAHGRRQDAFAESNLASFLKENPDLISLAYGSTGQVTNVVHQAGFSGIVVWARAASAGAFGASTESLAGARS